MRSALLRLHPATWRRRYGDEFEALLEERPLGPFDVADIVIGALDARLRTRGAAASSTIERGLSMSLRIGGYAAIVAGILLTVGLFGTSGLGVELDPAVGMSLFLIGALALLVALAGLSAFQARAHPALTWLAFALPAVGTAIIVIGIVGMAMWDDTEVVAGVSSWYIWIGGIVTVWVGSALFALVTYRTGALSRRAAVILAVGSLLPLLALANSIFGILGTLNGILDIAAWFGFAVGWVAIGLGALRSVDPAAAPTPV